MCTTYVLITVLRTQLLLRAVHPRGELGQVSVNDGDCRRVKWCPCTLDSGDDDDNDCDDTSDDTSKLLVVSDVNSVRCS